jgi:hypothetical protein
MRRTWIVFIALLMWPVGAHSNTQVIGPAGVIQRDPVLFQCDADGDTYPLEGMYRQAASAARIAHADIDAIRICNDRQDGHHYFLRDVRLTKSHLCRFTEQEVFPVYGPGNPTASPPRLVITSWSLAPPEDWRNKSYRSPARSFAYAGDGACPRADSAKYLEVQRVSKTPPAP